MSDNPAVMSTQILDGQLKNWTNEDYITIFRPLEQIGFYWEPMHERMERQGEVALSVNTPWSHAKTTRTKYCTLDHQIIFNTWQIIPERCLECWKIAVSPKNFKELLAMETLQQHMDVPCKCGMEMRDYTPKHYGGYWYTSSLDSGRKRFIEVKEAIAEYVSPECAETAILKRGCTEYEMVLGPSPFWNISKQDSEFVEVVESMVYLPRSQSDQARLIKKNLRLRWALWAHSHGDMSYMEFNGDKSMFPDYVKYHEGNLDDIKHDMALARASARGGMEPEVADKFLVLCADFAKDNSVSLNGLVHALGSNSPNPLNLMQIPETTYGDHDELT
jgi:hypothetical protein